MKAMGMKIRPGVLQTAIGGTTDKTQARRLQRVPNPNWCLDSVRSWLAVPPWQRKRPLASAGNRAPLAELAPARGLQMTMGAAWRLHSNSGNPDQCRQAGDMQSHVSARRGAWAVLWEQRGMQR